MLAIPDHQECAGNSAHRRWSWRSGEEPTMRLAADHSHLDNPAAAREESLDAATAELRLDIARLGQIDDVLRQQVDETKRRVERQYEKLIDSLEAIVWRADPSTLQFTFVSRQAESVLGYPSEQWFLPDFWESRLHPEDRLDVVASRKRAAQEMRHQAMDYRMIAADGGTVWLRDLVHVIAEQNLAKELIGVMVDMTDRKRAETSLREMTGRLINAQEEERRRIARELHDDLNQRLALLAIGFERLTQGLPPEVKICAQIEDLRKLTQDISSDVHRLSHRLHPAKLDHLGLVAAINGLCRELSEQYDFHIDFLHRDVPRPIPKDAALCLFRVAQEALSNIVKHSGVRTGRLELFGDRGSLHLCLSDSGIGFDLPSVSSKGRLGLISMQERVRAAGGEISIESSPSRGTRIVVQLSAQLCQP